jgi:hypothetical protein
MNGREEVVAKNGPFSLTFCQIVALMVPHRIMVAGRLDDVLVTMVFPSCVPSKYVPRERIRITGQVTE